MALHGGDIPRQSDSDSDRFQADDFEDDPNAIVTNAPEEPFRLGPFDVIFLVINRMIGTGIFSSVGRVSQGTQSVGTSLMFWFAGFVYSLAGVHVYIEYGLHIPRRVFEGVEQGIPRSGGDLNYLQYVYKKPAYRKDTVLLSVCAFAIVFILFGNVAGNCVSFAVRALQVANAEVTNGAVRGISIAVAFFTCFIHTLSRRGGILLSNFLAIIKIAMLLLIIIAAIVTAAGGFPRTKSVASENFDPNNSFHSASSEANGYAGAFLSIIFSFSGFEQPNYVLGEIAKPKRTFPGAMTTAVTVVGIIYMAVNVSYMSVVPKDDQLKYNIAERYFELTFGSLNTNSNIGERIFNAFLAISSFGNLIVMTYTAARVKQEIAKEGILPYPKFFAQNIDLSLGRLLRWLQRRPGTSKSFHRLLRSSWFAPEHHIEKTPVGALILHFTSCVVLILATFDVEPKNAYTLLSSVYSYIVHAFFGTLLGAGILYLRFNKKENWRKKAAGINPFLSSLSGSIYMIGNLFPLIASWVKPSEKFQQLAHVTVPWYVVPTLGWCSLALGGLWWLGFLGVAKRIEKREGTIFTIQREPAFERDPPGEGPPIQVNETVYLAWVAKENLPEGQDDFTEENGLNDINRTHVVDDFHDVYLPK